jgi:hypothetical protein
MSNSDAKRLIRRSKLEANIFRGSQKVSSLLWTVRHISLLTRNYDIRYIQWYSIWTTVELAYNVMKGIFCVVINNFFSNRGVGYNVRVTNQELIGTTEYLTLWTRFRINQCLYTVLDSISIILSLGVSLTSNQGNVVIYPRICAGDVLIVEEPYAWALSREGMTEHCWHCCRSVCAPVPCTQCATVSCLVYIA